jgi:hypothetical protein
VISGEGVAVDPEKVKALVEWTRLTSVFEIWSFLGLPGYYRRFIERFFKVFETTHGSDQEESLFRFDERV